MYSPGVTALTVYEYWIFPVNRPGKEQYPVVPYILIGALPVIPRRPVKLPPRIEPRVFDFKPSGRRSSITRLSWLFRVLRVIVATARSPCDMLERFRGFPDR